MGIGATSRLSGIMQSLGVLVLSFFLLRFFKYLPLPIVAAVIVYVPTTPLNSAGYMIMDTNSIDLPSRLLFEWWTSTTSFASGRWTKASSSSPFLLLVYA